MFKDFLDSHSRTLIMGILNITPDSFYDGGKFLDEKKVKSRFNILNKSDIIDIGAESSRPGAHKIDESIEIDRIKGKQSKEIETILGYLSKTEVIHKDDMVLL